MRKDYKLVYGTVTIIREDRGFNEDILYGQNPHQKILYCQNKKNKIKKIKTRRTLLGDDLHRWL